MPLSGEHSEIGNLILNAIEMVCLSDRENKLNCILRIRRQKVKSKKVLPELIHEGVKVVIGPLFPNL